VRNRSSGIKIEESASNPSPSPTPPKSTGGGTISADPTGRLNSNLALCWFHFFLFQPSYRTPWDIFPDSSMKGPEPSDDIPNGEDNPSSSGTKSSPHVSKALTSHNASPRTTILGLCPMENPWNFETAESPKTTPPNNPSDGIGSTGEDPIGGDSTQPEPRSLPR
jgi:hypothetical protein